MSRRRKLLARLVRRHYRTTPRRTYQWRDIEFFINGVRMDFLSFDYTFHPADYGDRVDAISYAWSYLT